MHLSQIDAAIRTRPFLQGEDTKSGCVQVNTGLHKIRVNDPVTKNKRDFQFTAVAPIGCSQVQKVPSLNVQSRSLTSQARLGLGGGDVHKGVLHNLVDARTPSDNRTTLELGMLQCTVSLIFSSVDPCVCNHPIACTLHMSFSIPLATVFHVLTLTLGTSARHARVCRRSFTTSRFTRWWIM